MDNKITKRRLHDFLSYEWIAIIAIIVVCILAWELIFTMTRVTLTPGQDFLVFYDETIDSEPSSTTPALYMRKDNSNRMVFSYDVLKVGHEELIAGYNVLSDRLLLKEGDVIITDCTECGTLFI